METITTKIYPNSPGIYGIKNKLNGRIYIGSTNNLYKRLIHHRHELNTNTHGNPHLQKSFNKYGISVFEIQLLENVKDVNVLMSREEFYCKQYDTLYNIKTIEKTSFGHKRITSEETKRKLSLSHRGKIPKNLKKFNNKHRRKIAKIVNDEIIEIFDSCKDAAQSLGMKPNAFHNYIGRTMKQKSKYIPKNTRYEYYTR